MAVAGRSRTSSRLAPTIRGSPGTSRDATTRRHTTCTLPRSRSAGPSRPGGACTPGDPSAGYRSAMRTRLVTVTVALGLGPCSCCRRCRRRAGRPPPNIKALTNSINRAKNLTYLAQYTSVSSGQSTTVTIAQSPPKSNFSTSERQRDQQRQDDLLLLVQSGSSGNSGNSGSGNSGNSGNSGSVARPRPPQAQQCLSVKGANPLLGVENIFSPAVALGALAEAKQGLVSRLLGIKVTSSSASFAGQPSTCVTVTVRGKGGKYCVTKQGILSYSGSSTSYFKLTKYSSKPPASLFSLPAGATTQTLPGGALHPVGHRCRAPGRRATFPGAPRTTAASRTWPPPASTCTARRRSSTRTARARSSTPAVAPGGSRSSSPPRPRWSSASTSTAPCSRRPARRRPSWTGSRGT